MGMDLTVYRLLEPLSPQAYAAFEGPSRLLMLREAQRAQVKALFAHSAPVRQEVINTEKLLRDLNLDDQWSLRAWDLSQPTGHVTLGRYTLTDDSVEERSFEVMSRDYVEVTDLYEEPFAVQELGYIRKPFRKASTPTRVEGNTLVLSTDNFTGNDEQALKQLLGPGATRDCYVCLFHEDMATLEALQAYCYDPAYWREQVVNRMQRGCVVVIDW